MRPRIWSRLTYAGPATAVSLAVILALVGLALAAFTGAEAAGQGQPQCGDTITADTTLHHDLTNCPNNGIIIGADNITLDLNYHTIDGDGTPAAGCDPSAEVCDSGVVDDGHDGVTVVHGSVHEFEVGVLFGTSTAGRVRHNRVIDISSSKNHFIGFVIASSVRSLVRDSSGSASTARRDGTGLGLFGSHRVRIIHSSFRRNAGDHAIVTVDSNNNLIRGNRFSGNDGEGILMEGGERNRIRRNRLVGNVAGITLGPGSHNTIIRNRIAGGRDGIRIEKGRGNLVADNVVVGTRQAGIRLGIRHPFLGGAHNVVRGNLVKRSRLDGFLVNSKDSHSRLRHNIARRAGDDGFDIKSRTAKLTKNRAFRNHDLGIEAVRGVNDGGGNIARHNGDRRQCINIACS